MERYEIFTATSRDEIKHKYILDKLNNDENIEHRIYFDITIGDMLVYVYDNEAKQIVAYASLDLMRKPKTTLYIAKIETFDKSIAGVDNRNKGIASKLLKNITQFARENDYECIQLSAVNKRAERLYFEHGFVTYGTHERGWARMEKEVNPSYWRLSCLIFEATKEAYQNLTTVKEEVNKIIKNKYYDNLFEYNVVEENPYSEKYNPYTAFKTLDKNLKNDIKKYKDILEELYPKLDNMLVYGNNNLKYNVYKMGMMIPNSHPLVIHQDVVVKDRICRNVFNLFVDDSLNKNEETKEKESTNKKTIYVPLPKGKTHMIERSKNQDFFKGK